MANIKWSFGEEKFLRENFNRLSDRELLEKLKLISPSHCLNLDLDTLRRKRQRMGLIRK